MQNGSVEVLPAELAKNISTAHLALANYRPLLAWRLTQSVSAGTGYPEAGGRGDSRRTGYGFDAPGFREDSRQAPAR